MGFYGSLIFGEVSDRRPQSIIDIKEAAIFFANSTEQEAVAEVVKNFRKRVFTE